jgi:hypothetical protein
MEFFNLHTLVIGAKFFKEFVDKVKSEKNPFLDSQTVATIPRHKRTYISPYDSGRWGRCRRNQPTFNDGKVIW